MLLSSGISSLYWLHYMNQWIRYNNKIFQKTLTVTCNLIKTSWQKNLIDFWNTGSRKFQEQHIKTMTISVVIGALGIMKKNTDIQTKKIPRNLCLSKIQMITLMSSGQILRKFSWSDMFNKLKEKSLFISGLS